MKTPQEAADELLGTCQSLHEVIGDGENNDLNWCGELDAIVAECSVCGWWVEADDVNDNDECSGCDSGDDEEDDDD